MKTIELYIPAKVMLAGEYAVLRGGHSLAATLNCGMSVKVNWDPTAAQWEIHSDIWNAPQFVQDDRTPQSDILCRAVQFAAKRTGLHGGRVEINSSIEIKHGIGSSSALRLGICAAFLSLRDGSGENAKIPLEAVQTAWQLQSEGQGIASGYDIVTQYAGGLVEFRYEYDDNKWKPHWFRHELGAINQLVHVFVGGVGAPTTETIQTMSSWLEGGNRFDKLVDTSEGLIDAFNTALQWPDPTSMRKLCHACGNARQMFATSPHFPQILGAELARIPGIDQRWSWKTTGAGGEDAILLIGTKEDTHRAASRLADLGWHPVGHTFVAEGTRVRHFNASESLETESPVPSRASKSAMREFLG